MAFYDLLRSAALISVFAGAAAQPLKTNPTPQDYIERNGGGATIVPPGQLVLDGRRVSCGEWPTAASRRPGPSSKNC